MGGRQLALASLPLTSAHRSLPVSFAARTASVGGLAQLRSASSVVTFEKILDVDEGGRD